MKLAYFSHAGCARLGALYHDGNIVDLADAELRIAGQHSGCFTDMLSLINAGAQGMEKAKWLMESVVETIPVHACKLLAPLPLPPQIRDFMCFEKHVEQSLVSIAKIRAVAAGVDPSVAVQKAGSAGALKIPDIWYRQPLYYKANRFAVSGTEDEVFWPTYSSLIDYECEIACILGTGGVNISKDKAGQHIFGYTVFNDFSARDAQSAEIQGFLGPAKGKDFDRANAMGPYVVTADEFNPADDHAMIVRVNGEERSRGSTNQMHWTFADLIAHVSQDETMHAGEILGSGTVGGGCGLELMKFLECDDVIELEIEGIGVLRNTIRRKMQ